MRKKICIAGYTGFIGRYIVPRFKEYGYYVVGIEKYDIIRGNEKKILEDINGSFAVINLAGVSINRRWSKKNRELIRKSRVETTEALIKAMWKLKNKPEVFINASGIDIYPASKICDEECSEINNSFLAEVIKEWEDMAERAKEIGIRTIKARFGVVFGKDGGVFKIFTQVVSNLFGIVFGSGEQHMSIIHIEDLFQICKFLIERKNIDGVVNFVIPDQIKQKDFVEYLCSKYGKKVNMSINRKLIMLLLGERSCLLLDDRIVYPKRLIENGYFFKYKNIYEVVDSLSER